MTNDYLPGVALITGASSGLGRAAAICFAKERCQRIFIGDIVEEGLHVTKTQILEVNPDAQVGLAKVNISEEQSVEGFVGACVQQFGRVDYACNIAGIVPPRQSIIENTTKVYDDVIAVNECGTWLCHRAEIRRMLEQEPLPGYDVKGSIVSVSSIAGINSSPGATPYSSSKFALVGLCKADAQDYGPQGIRINVVCPGVTDTEAFRKITPAGGDEAVKAITPLGRLGKPEDTGLTLAFLSSSKASFIHGAVIVVDGGISLQRMAVGRTAALVQGGQHFHTGG